MMKNWKVVLSSLLAVLILAACGNKVDDATAEVYIGKAEEIVQYLNDGKFDEIVEQFDDTMKENLTAVQLAEITPLLEESGAFVKVEKQSVEEKDGAKIVVLVAKHEEDKRIYTVSYNDKDQIAGLFIQ